jgi:hypothetical protein
MIHKLKRIKRFIAKSNELMLIKWYELFHTQLRTKQKEKRKPNSSLNQKFIVTKVAADIPFTLPYVQQGLQKKIMLTTMNIF